MKDGDSIYRRPRPKQPQILTPTPVLIAFFQAVHNLGAEAPETEPAAKETQRPGEKKAA